MSDRMPRMSRRKLLQIGSVAPLSALLMKGGATNDEICMLAPSLVKKVEDKLWSNAIKNIPEPQEEKFRTAVRVLVEYFVAGAAHNGVVVPHDEAKQTVLFVTVAYEQPSSKKKTKSGDLIAMGANKWEEAMFQTNVCAFLCGSEFAKADPTPDYTDEKLRKAYEKAYKKVEETMTILFTRLGHDQPENLGAGC